MASSPQPSPSSPSPDPAARLLPRWAWLVVALVLVAIYLVGSRAYPARGEEPRRVLVAQEMIHSGDYVVPRLLGEPYYGKPPLQNWLIAVLSGFNVARAGAIHARLISLLCVALVAWLLWRSGRDDSGGPDPLPAVIFLSLSLVVTFGRTGEVDMLQAGLVWAAFASFESGRRRDAPWRMWFWPQILVAAGALAKGLAPLFFYVPVLFVAWRRPRAFRFSPFAALAGAIGFVVLVGTWLLPYALATPVESAGGTWWSEIRNRFSLETDVLLVHLVTYPLLLVGTLLPWSIGLVSLRRRAARRALRRVLNDPWALLCGVILAWAATVYLLVPAVRGRYFLPAVPAFAVLAAHLVHPAESVAVGRSRRGLLALAGVAVVVAVYLVMDPLRRGEPVAAVAAVAMLCLSTLAVAGRGRRPGAMFRALLALGLTWGATAALVVDARESRRSRPFSEATAVMAPAVPPDRMVVTDAILSHKVHLAMTRALGRPMTVEFPRLSPYTWIGPFEMTPPEDAIRRLDAWHYTVWEIPAGRRPHPGLWSGYDVDPEERRAAAAAARTARGRFERRPWEERARVDLGRRLLEAGEAVPAARVFTQGLMEQPLDPVLRLRRGQARLRSGDAAAAIVDLEAALASLESSGPMVGPGQGPEAGPTRRMIARLKTVASGLLGDDGTEWRRTLREQALGEAALAELTSGDIARAEARLRRAVDIAGSTGGAATPYWLTVVLTLDGRHAEARRVATEHILKHEALPDPYSGLLRLAAGEWSTADVIDLRVDSVDGHGLVAFGLAMHALGEGDASAAQAALAEIEQRFPPTSMGAVAVRAVRPLVGRGGPQDEGGPVPGASDASAAGGEPGAAGAGL